MEGMNVKDSKCFFTLPGDVNPNGDKILGVGKGLDEGNAKALKAASAAAEDNFIQESLTRTAEYDKKRKEELSKSSAEELKATLDGYKRDYDNQENSQVKVGITTVFL